MRRRSVQKTNELDIDLGRRMCSEHFPEEAGTSQTCLSGPLNWVEGVMGRIFPDWGRHVTVDSIMPRREGEEARGVCSHREHGDSGKWPMRKSSTGRWGPESAAETSKPVLAAFAELRYTCGILFNLGQRVLKGKCKTGICTE